ncbi:MAG: hypothetical protein ACODAU_02070 [Myxococcota bacterium]
MKRAGSILGAVGLAAVMAFALSSWVKGQVFGFVWQTFGNDTFSCGGDWTVNIRGKTLESDGTLVSAGGNCKITLTDCHLKGAETVSTGGNAELIIEGGTIEGTSAAVSSAGSRLEIRNATLEGDDVGLRFYGNRSESATVRGSTIEGRTALEAVSGAEIAFVDSTLRGSPTAVRASGTSVDLGNSEVTGAVETTSGAEVVPQPSPKQAEAPGAVGD